MGSRPRQRLLDGDLEAEGIGATASGASPGRAAAARVLEQLHGGEVDLALIEISSEGSSEADGGGSRTITHLDLDAAAAALQAGGGAGAGSLPFHPEFFDYAIALDALDHLEPRLRPALLAELRRLSRRGVVVCGPFDSPIVRGVERLSSAGRAGVEGRDESALPARHPSLDQTKRFFEAHGDHVTVLGDGCLPLWAIGSCMSIATPELAGELHQLEQGAHYRPRSDTDHASYRSLLVSLREPPEAGVFDAIERDDAGQADAASVAGMLAATALATELCELRSRLAAEEGRLAKARATLARRNAQVEDLSRRLADSLAALAAERGERPVPQHEIATMQKARAWRLMARTYYASGRLRAAAQAPVRMARDLRGRVRRRLRAL